MTNFLLSDRLEKIASLITDGGTVADIGTDHGYLPVYLAKSGKVKKVIAADLREKPLERAKKNAADRLVSDRIEFRISDGLDAFTLGEADTFVLCGMGGFAILKILQRALDEKKFFKGNEFVISPHADRESLSEFLYKNGFKIEKEIMLHERLAYYILWKCRYDAIKRSASKEAYAYGELLLKERAPALKSFLLREEELLLRIMERLDKLPPQSVKKRAEDVRERLKMNRAVRWF